MPKTIVLIDPVYQVLKDLKATLGRCGYVITLASLRDLSNVLVSRPDLLVVDLTTHPDAVEFCRSLKSRIPSQPILVLGTLDAAAVPARLDGVFVFGRPFGPVMLAMAVRAALRGDLQYAGRMSS